MLVREITENNNENKHILLVCTCDYFYCKIPDLSSWTIPIPELGFIGITIKPLYEKNGANLMRISFFIKNITFTFIFAILRVLIEQMMISQNVLILIHDTQKKRI